MRHKKETKRTRGKQSSANAQKIREKVFEEVANITAAVSK
jgi:hypothetical protein